MYINGMNTSIGFSISLALGGLGLFLVAIKLMSSSMKTMSSGITVKLLRRLSKNRWLGLLFGVVFTTMIQSSDGAIALAIGLIGAGLLTLRGAIPFILGANIGTATTAVIVAVGGSSIKELEFVQYFMLFAFIGAMILLFVKEEKKTNIAMLIFAIGAIFLGLKVMSLGMKAITAKDGFKHFVGSVGSNPWLSMFTNTALTGMVQSSSATVTVVQNLYSVNSETGASLMGLPSAIGMVIGANIGTTFTALIASIGGHRDARRIAVVWLITNLFMALSIMPFINQYSDLVKEIQSVPTYHKGMDTSLINEINTHQKFQLAWAHLLFNSMLAIIFIWFVRPLEWIAKKIVPNKKNEFAYDVNPPRELINESPDLAFVAAQKAAVNVSKMSQDAIGLINEYINTGDIKKFYKLQELNEMIDQSRANLYAYLIEVGSRDISKKTSNRQLSLVLALRSLERIPSLGTEIAKEFRKVQKRSAFDMNKSDLKEMKDLISKVLEITEKSSKQISRYSFKRSDAVHEMNNNIEELGEQYSRNHVKRSVVGSFDFILAIKWIIRMSHHAQRVDSYICRGVDRPNNKKKSSTNTKNDTNTLMVKTSKSTKKANDKSAKKAEKKIAKRETKK